MAANSFPIFNCGNLAYKGGRRGAFTLVEVLVVIGIITILIGLLVPAISRARDSANTTACLSNLRVLGQCMFVYANTYNNRLPDGNAPTEWTDLAAADQVMVDFNDNFVNSPNVFWCPSSPISRNSTIDTAEMCTLDQPIPNSARVSYDFYGLYWPPEYGPLLTKFTSDTPIAWDLNGGLLLTKPPTTEVPVQNHGSAGGNVLYADDHAAWEPRTKWDDTNWPDPANLYYPPDPNQSISASLSAN